MVVRAVVRPTAQGNSVVKHDFRIGLVQARSALPVDEPADDSCDDAARAMDRGQARRLYTAWNERQARSIARQPLLTVDRLRRWLKFCMAEKAVHGGDVCICTCRTELGGAKQRNHVEEACTCFGERRSRRQMIALPRASLGALFGPRREQPSIFPLLARRH